LKLATLSFSLHQIENMRSSPAWLILAGFMILLDLYVFQIIRTVSHGSPRTRSIIFTSYWIISIAALIILFVLPLLNLDNYSKGVRSTVFAIIIGLFLAKLIAAVFFLIDDIRRGIQWMVGKIFFRGTEGEQIEEERISRSLFLSWLGLAVGGGLFSSLLYGFSNKYNYKVKKVKLSYPNLPPSFKGLKVVQISDIHSGSFTDKAAVQHGIEKILQLRPDLILFTGDLVNNKSDEMRDYMDVFSRLKAPMGVYSTLGNHDYGDYAQWPSKEAKVENLEQLKQIHGQMGWRLLMNENVLLERNGEQIALIGIENWSAKARFPKYGNLAKAYAGAENIPFKILMSHDPSHWDAEVRPKYSDIDLMLAGHTHGMQFGVEIPWLKWSPVQYVYKQWAGLYSQGHQKLYVNRGFGFIGYPGRVGILPEITFFELA
jgi:predicted MPP superfamily phosphohydrolase